jgi:hypothetical protein
MVVTAEGGEDHLRLGSNILWEESLMRCRVGCICLWLCLRQNKEVDSQGGPCQHDDARKHRM